MLTHSLKGISLPKNVTTLQTPLIAAHQIVPFLLLYIFGRSVNKNTASTNLIKIVQILGCILLQNIRVYQIQGRDTLRFKSYIIIIGGSHNAKLTLSIYHTSLKPFGESITLFINTTKNPLSPLIIIVELLIA